MSERKRKCDKIIEKKGLAKDTLAKNTDKKSLVG